MLHDSMIWHPFTQHKTAAIPIHVKRGEGIYLYDTDNKKYIDLISSWWVNLHGHANKKIADAIYQQAITLEHVIFAGFTHSPAIDLCKAISNYLPQDLKKFFFSDNGSTAVEVAIKMAYQFWFNQNQKNRTIFFSFEGAYHGDTVGAMSVAPTSTFHQAFRKLFFQTISIPLPYTWHGDLDIESKEDHSLEILSNQLKKYEGNIAAFIIEPLIQGAGGMRCYRATFLQKVIKILREHNILVIFDEVMTGFYRTGYMFALESVATYTPDIICVAKGITGGFLPLSLTITTEKIYNAFLSNLFDKALAHGHSYTANPLACAAANASLEILRQKEVILNIHQIIKLQSNFLLDLHDNFGAIIRYTRQIGTIAAFDIDEQFCIHKISKELLANGLLIRPLKNTIYIMPPYCITEEELNISYNIIKNILLKIIP